MSVKALAWAWVQDIPATTKMVLMALADHADDDGVCWPGIKGVSEKCGLNPRSVRRHISRLCHMGLIESVPRYRSDGSRTSNLFILKMQPSQNIPDLELATEVPKAGWTELSAPPDTSVRTRTVIEPSLEPSRDIRELSAVLEELRRLDVWKKVSQAEEIRLLLWLREKKVAADAALRAATALVGKWNGKKYKDPVATYKNWVLVEMYGTTRRKEVNHGKPGRRAAPGNPEDFFQGVRDTGIDHES